MAYRISLIVFGIILLVGIANAADTTNQKTTYTLLQPIPCIQSVDQGGKVTVPCETPAQNGTVPLLTKIDLTTFIQYAFNLLIATASVAAVFMMVWGGFQYVTSDAFGKKNEGINKFKNSIYGLLMILLAFLILRTVNPKLVQFPTEIPKITSKNFSSPTGGTGSAPNQPNVTNPSQNALQNSTINAQEKNLESQKATLERQLTDAQQRDDMQAASDIQTQIDKIDEQLSDLNKQTVFTNTMSKFQHDVDLASQGKNSAATIENLIEAVKDDFNSAKPDLVNSPYLTQLQDNQNYSIGILTVQRDIARGGKTVASDISHDVIDNISKLIGDQTLANKLVQYAKDTINSLKK